MNVIRTENPSQRQLKDLLALQNTCQSHDQFSLTLPLEEDCLCYLLYDKENLLSALCAVFDEGTGWECYGCTLPDERRKGYFRLLLEHLEAEAEDSELIFPACPSCSDAIEALNAIGAVFWYSEHMMELSLSSPLPVPAFKVPGLSEEITIQPKPDRLRQEKDYRFFHRGSLAGQCFLDFSGSQVYFYGFEICKELRGRGLGGACLTKLLKSLSSLPDSVRPKRILLQVSGQNLPALRLYEKTGFQPFESLSYYVY